MLVAHSLVMLSTSLAVWNLRVGEYHLLSRLSIITTTKLLLPSVTQLLNLRNLFAYLLKTVRNFALQVIHDELDELLILSLWVGQPALHGSPYNIPVPT